MLLGGWAKKPFAYALLTGGALVVTFVVLPAIHPAQAFSLDATDPNTLQNADLSYNSQTMPLLSPAVNLDPNPAEGGGDITVADGSALEAQDNPTGTADINQWPTSSQISVYTVHAGDTLSSIAELFSVSVNTIVWANDIQGGVVHPGEMLVILPITGVEHTVVKGETLASIAKKYSADANEIAQYNGLDPSLALTPGTSVIIPDGEISGGSSTSSSRSVSHSGSSSRGLVEPYLGGSGPAIPGYFAWPINGGVITQGLHGWNAVDIGAPRGTQIYAAASGIVIVARANGAWNGGYGNYVVIAHPNGTETLYAHMSRVLVSAGTSVTQGETIGLVGATGLATGPHLHFEVRGAVNPFASLPLGSSE
ncbi:MAG: peptidoglycan DD-metalloendopeptidase family protein [Patescibacteria group bacterium]|nr:peptidoglycan DD-metalloendopeptidase family protein [Patescibacteria group bacterium]